METSKATHQDQEAPKHISNFKTSAKKQTNIPVVSTSLKSLKQAENFTSPIAVNIEKKRAKAAKKVVKVSIDGQVQPKSSVASPVLEERTTTNEKRANR